MTQQQLLNTVKSGMSRLSPRIVTRHAWVDVDSCPDRLYIDNGEPIRFRVSDIDWQPKKPRPEIPEWKAELEAEDEMEKVDPIDEAGFRIMGTIAESGLGIVHWWAETPEEPQEMDQEEE
jgi:DNA-directed RNA polymerase subunit E'/Rpb7